MRHADKDLDSTCVVCERHFEAQFVGKTLDHVVDRELVKIERDRLSLSGDAVPIVFPEAPSYLTQKLSKERKAGNLCQQLWHIKSLKRTSCHDCATELTVLSLQAERKPSSCFTRSLIMEDCYMLLNPCHTL